MDAAVRIIDANANRAREALRVMEDAARFALDDQDLCSQLKKLRHDLRTALDSLGLDRSRLVAHRDTLHDVGTGVWTAQELRRTGVGSVVKAASSRLTEALRSIEETAKTLRDDDEADQAIRLIESIRYAAYTIERRLVLAFGTGRCPQWRVCVLVTEGLCTKMGWEDVTREAVQAGADCVQLREKSLGDKELLRRARRIVEIARSAGAAAIINDRPDVAILSKADGVHLGQGDLPLDEVRRLAGGEDFFVGASASNLDEVRFAVQHGADYFAVGTMFPSTTKSKPTITGPGLVREVRAMAVLSARPMLAIGGISPANIASLVEAGCPGVAVSGCVCSAENPGDVVRTLLAAIESAKPIEGETTDSPVA